MLKQSIGVSDNIVSQVVFPEKLIETVHLEERCRGKAF